MVKPMHTVLLLLFVLPISARALELQVVLDNAAVAPPARVDFQEQRHNEMFAVPLELSGYLEYIADGQLRKVIEVPFAEAFFVNGDRIEVERQGEIRVLPINKSRSLQAMLGGIEAILAAKTDEIEKVFHFQLSGAENDWSLHLTPRSRRVAKRLLGLTVTGNDESIKTIRVDLPDGEWHLLEIRRASDSP